LIQLPAALVKLLVHGQDEAWIGTVSVLTGGLSTTLPLVAISFLASFYFIRPRWGYAGLIIAYYIFGIIGEKRGIALLIPLVVIVIYILYLSTRQDFFAALRLKNLIYPLMVLMISCTFVFTSALFVKTFNPENKYWGGFDWKYILYDRIIGYNIRDLEYENSPEMTENLEILRDAENRTHLFKPESRMGRFTISLKAVEKLFDGGFLKIMFGFGPGAMIQSPHLGRSREMPFEKFGIYGTYTSFVFYVLQIGFLGVIFLWLFFYRIFRVTLNKLRSSQCTNEQAFCLGLLGMSFVFLLDFFAYSQTTLSQPALLTVYLYSATLIIRGYSTKSLLDASERRQAGAANNPQNICQ
jgi:hypothetical protein